MRLAAHFTRSGDVLFRWRSYVPLLLLPLVLLSLLDARESGTVRHWGRAWDVACLMVSLSGFALRVYVVGTAPSGTSERSTTDPRAAVLSTAGAYSVVRHPLYIGNTLVALGLAGIAGRWYLPVIVGLASLLYHERVCAREEAFLEQRFGDQFCNWAGRVNALVPSTRSATRAPGRFNWRDVFRREFHGLFVIGGGFFILALGRDSLAAGRLAVDPVWAWIAGATGGIFVALTVVKRLARLLA